MAYDSWTCIMVRNGPGLIPDLVRQRLKLEACRLYAKEKERAGFKTPECSGVLLSTRRAHSVGARTGILFKAEVEISGHPECQINFLLSVADLERGAQFVQQVEEANRAVMVPGMVDECPELYQFKNLSRRA